MTALLPWLGDLVVLVGTFVTTVAVLGIYRFDDVLMQIHAAAKGVGFGAGLTSLVGLFSGDLAFAAKALLVFVALVVTAPIGSHVLARLAYEER